MGSLGEAARALVPVLSSQRLTADPPSLPEGRGLPVLSWASHSSSNPVSLGHANRMV